MDQTGQVLAVSHALYARADPNAPSRPPVYKAIGITLAIASGLFIGTSFVLKKVGLLKANVKYNEEAGEGYGYLKNTYWWTGMTLMIIGEICNFVAYAFVDAILVTPLGALSVVITTILSAIFLKERLSFVGKIGCFICIIGSIIIVLNAPPQSSAATIQDMQRFVLAPGFLVYTGLVLVGCTFIAVWAGPRYGKKSMLVYLTICSLIGGLSVVATQGLGAAVVAQAGGKPQFNQWFLYVLLVFVTGTLVTEIIFLNKALNLFNAALVTPTYYVFFTSATIVSSSILFQGFNGTPSSIATIIMGFLQICSGVVLLQLSKSAKNVPDAAVFAGDLDQMRTVAEQEEPESEPKADAIRGAAAIIRRISQSRQKVEAEEAKRFYEDRKRDQMDSIGENERIEWDGLRRRRTILEPSHGERIIRRKTLHPPLGLSKFPDPEDPMPGRPITPRHATPTTAGSFLSSFRNSRPHSAKSPAPLALDASASERRPGDAEGSNQTAPYRAVDFASTGSNTGENMEMERVYGLPSGLAQHPTASGSNRSIEELHGKPIAWAPDVVDSKAVHDHLALDGQPTARRQFSFQNVFHRGQKHDSQVELPTSRRGLNPRSTSKEFGLPTVKKIATEEERLGLVKGGSPDLRTEDSNSEDEDGKVRGLDLQNLTEKEHEHSSDGWTLHDPAPGHSLPLPSALTPGSKPLPLTPRTPSTPNPGRNVPDERERGQYENVGLGLERTLQESHPDHAFL